MKKTPLPLLVLALMTLLFSSFSLNWGFYGHRLINRKAVFTLPPEMIPFYKKNIEFITEHAVDADKRRYATKHEAIRHYIDIDHWGKPPFPEVPRRWTDALMKYTSIFVINTSNDTLLVLENEKLDLQPGGTIPLNSIFEGKRISRPGYQQFFIKNILPQYYEDQWVVDCDSLQQLLGPTDVKLDCHSAFASEHFTEYGILPYHLIQIQRRLTNAFKEKDHQRIIRISTDLGHYLADAHVPLHTTENYNGELTNQLGIHAFWESRIPELFAEQEWDFFVGPANYIDKPDEYFWDIILKSHSYVDTLLSIERELRQSLPEDKQFCYEERLGQTVRIQCKAFASAYNKRLNGQVEARMQEAIHAIGSAWYTAWVDAGQPILTHPDPILPDETEIQRQDEEETLYRKGAIKGRKH